MDKQEFYICPDCEQREKGPGQAGPGVGEKYYQNPICPNNLLMLRKYFRKRGIL